MKQNPKFRTGDRVVDRDADNNQMIVLDPNVGPANEVEVDGLDATVAELNETYPPRDPVVSVVFVSWLDTHVPGWKDWEDQRLFSDTLRDNADKWGVSLRTYRYPESRLERPMISGSGSEDSGGEPSINASTSCDGSTQKSTMKPTSSTASTMSTSGWLPSLSAEEIAVAATQR